MGADPCQVDFYVLADGAPDETDLACRLALMAWERGHRVELLAAGAGQAEHLDRRLWAYPPDRLVPHGLSGTADGDVAPVVIHAEAAPLGSDVVINLRPAPCPDPQRLKRLLELVPAVAEHRDTAREKFRFYRDLGLEPATHDIGR